MKKSQRWMSLLVTASLVLLSPNALGETDGDWEFWYSGSTAAITGYNGPLADISIPSTVSRTESYEEQDDDGEWHTHHRTYQYSVTSIEESAFSGCSGLTSVTIPDSVTSIGRSAFEGCSDLTSVTIGNGVTKIGNYAFQNCTGLTAVYIHSLATWCGISFVYAANPLSYAHHLYLDGEEVIDLVIPDGVTSIGYAFEGCNNLASVTIPDSVTNLGHCVFRDCSGLTSVTIPDNVTSIGGFAFEGCSGLTSVTIPDNVTSIGGYAFSGCSSLTSVTIGNSVTNIEWYAFKDCSSLTAIHIHSLATWCGLSFLPTSNNPLSYAHHLYLDGEEVIDLVIPDGVTSIGGGTFCDCTGLTSVTIPDSVTSIGSCAFEKCSALTNATIPNSVTSIGNYAFCNCSFLTNVTIPDSVTSIGHHAFYNCSGLESVRIGNSVTSIERYTFYDCTGLASVTIPDSVTDIGYQAFSACSGLTSVTIGNGVTSIDGYAFSRCGRLASIRFAGEPPTVGDKVFLYVSDSARGYYTEQYAEAWEAVIDQDGKWEGLIMEKELRVDSANPASGSLTLAWEMLEAETEGVTYSVWRGAGGERKDAECVKSGLTENTWEDKEYWKAEPVLKPLNYWVVAKESDGKERASNRVETRHRYGVFVGVGKSKSSNSPDPSDISNAELFGWLAREKGGFTVNVIPGTRAEKKIVRKTIQSLAEKMQTGDYAVLFFSSHGDDTLWKRIRNRMNSEVKLNFASIDLYDADYNKEELADDLKGLLKGKNGVGVVVVVNSCLSGGAVDAVSEEGQIGWITSCADGEITPSWTSTLGTPLPLFLLEYGWNRGMAGSGEFVTFGELANYACPALAAFLERTSWVNHPVVDGGKVLEHFVAGRHGSATHATVPVVPSGVDATTGEAKLRVSWKAQSDADWFIMERSTVPATTRETMIDNGRSTGGVDASADLYGKSYFYRVAAMNEWGISGWSDSATGSRHNPELVEWVKQQCDCGESASPVALAAAAALSSANGASYEACYLAGIDPNDPKAAFEAALVREDGKWQVKPLGDTKEGRVYYVEGKKAMSDEVWTDVTGVEDLEAEGWRFFRVGVELAE